MSAIKNQKRNDEAKSIAGLCCDGWLGCPWCGSKPKLITQRVPCGPLGYKFGMQASLWCVNHKCPVQPQVSASAVRTFEMKNPYDPKENARAFASLEKSKSKSIAAVEKIWNTRKHPNEKLTNRTVENPKP